MRHWLLNYLDYHYSNHVRFGPSSFLSTRMYSSTSHGDFVVKQVLDARREDHTTVAHVTTVSELLAVRSSR